MKNPLQSNSPFSRGWHSCHLGGPFLSFATFHRKKQKAVGAGWREALHQYTSNLLKALSDVFAANAKHISILMLFTLFVSSSCFPSLPTSIISHAEGHTRLFQPMQTCWTILYEVEVFQRENTSLLNYDNSENQHITRTWIWKMQT